VVVAPDTDIYVSTAKGPPFGKSLQLLILSIILARLYNSKWRSRLRSMGTKCLPQMKTDLVSLNIVTSMI